MPPALPLAHVSWALADNAGRPACDAFFIDVFGAATAHEILLTPETEAMGFDREERLMLIGDAMLIPIAPAGRGASAQSPLGNMLRRSAGENRWIGLALRVADLPAADAWFRARGFQLHYDPGMEGHYFLISRKQVLGMRLELMVGVLPNDPRPQPGGAEALRAAAAAHPLGIESLMAVGVSVPSLGEARAVFAGRLELAELAEGHCPRENADMASFLLGDAVIEALAPREAGSPLARHLAEAQGIRSLTFKVRDAAAAAEWLRGRGFALIGDPAERFAILPEQAQGRLIWLTDSVPPTYPAPGSRLHQPAQFPPIGG